MKGDFSKNTYRKDKHFHDVRMQQGRVLLDTDWNEQVDITSHRIETGTLDIIGKTGAPLDNAGFEIVLKNGDKELSISDGRFYVDGILCENDKEVAFTNQPDYKVTLPTEERNYLFYLDVWQRHITVLEDPDIREVALGGPDTTTRTKTVWQVKYQPVTNDYNCLTPLSLLRADNVIGKLRARSETPTGTEDPCGLATSGGYRRLTNQLYRVEIHTPGSRDDATFKWSRDNGSVLVNGESYNSTTYDLVVSSTGRDELLGFESGDWVELIEDKNDLDGSPGILMQISNVNGNVFTINPTTIHPINAIIPPNLKNHRIRRWDSAGALELNTSDQEWIELEDGVQVQFTGGTYNTGDYWLIPARTLTADIEWPFSDPQPPQGIQHHFAKLAILHKTSTGWAVVSDCRPKLPTLTKLTALYYVGGDGQEARPGQQLLNPLRVGVANGQRPVMGARVRFSIVEGRGSLAPINSNGHPPNYTELNVATGLDGVAACNWILGTLTRQEVKVTLLDAADNVSPHHLPVIFNASLSIASNVAYSSRCTNWGDALNLPPTTVAAALDALCELRGINEGNSRKGCCVTVGVGGDYETLEAAFAAVQDFESICICLLPGNHSIRNVIQETQATIEIKGYGAYITMEPNAGLFTLNAQKILFQGFKLVVNQDFSASIILTANEVKIDGCSFSGGHPNSISQFIWIRCPDISAGSVIYWNNNQVEYGNLAIGPSVGGWIKNSIFINDLILKYSGPEIGGPGWNYSNIDGKLAQWGNELPRTLSISHHNEILHIHSNTFDKVTTNSLRSLDNPQGTLDAYKNLIVSENIFNGNRNSFLSETFSLINNHFLAGQDNLTPVYALGHRGVFIGNIAITKTQFKTLFDPTLKMVNANLCNIQE